MTGTWWALDAEDNRVSHAISKQRRFERVVLTLCGLQGDFQFRQARPAKVICPNCTAKLEEIEQAKETQ